MIGSDVPLFRARPTKGVDRKDNVGRTLALLALVVSSIGPVPCARADGPVVLARLPVERHDEMVAALRLELAGRAVVVEGPPVGTDELTVERMRDEARAAQATHVVWVVYPGGALWPAEIRLLDAERTAPAHAMTPQAWDVVDARLVAVIAGSLLDQGEPLPIAQRESVADAETIGDPGAEVARVDGAEATEVLVVASETAVAPEADLPAVPEVALTVDPRRARRFSLSFGTGIAHQRAPLASAPLTPGDTGISYGHTEVAFYGRVTEWASIGMRFRLGGFGYSDLAGVTLSGAIGVPSIMVSFREPLGTAAMIELGIHTEGGLFFYGRSLSEWSFGLGAGAFATLELGEVNGIQLDYTLDLYGFGDSGSYSWGSASLSYVRRFD